MMFMKKDFVVFRYLFDPLKISLVLAGFTVTGESLARASDPELEFNLIDSRVAEGPLRLDLMVPAEGEGPYPVVVVIHGGAWRRGDKVENRPIMFKLAQKGYATVSPQYRLAPENPFPAALHDVKEAVRWVKANAKAQLVDAGHIGVHGQTAVRVLRSISQGEVRSFFRQKQAAAVDLDVNDRRIVFSLDPRQAQPLTCPRSS